MSESKNLTSPQYHITIPGFLRVFKSPILTAAAALLVINLLDVCLPLIIREFVDSLRGEKGQINPLQDFAASDILTWCVIAYLSAAGLQCFCRVAWRVLLGRVGVRVATLARHEAAKSALRYPHKSGMGDAVAATQSDAENFARSFDGGVIISIDAFMGVVTIPTILFYLDPHLAWRVLIPLPFVTLLAAYLDGKVREASHTVQAATSQMVDLGEKLITNARIVKTNTLEDDSVSRFAAASTQLRDGSKRLLLLESVYGPGLESFISLGLVTLMVFGTTSVLEGGITLGTFLAFHKYIEQLQWPMRAVALALTTFRKSQVGGERLREFIERCTAKDPEMETGSIPRLESPPTEGVISLRNSPQGTCFTIDRGEIVAVIGPIGSGKSLLLKRLIGVVDILPGLAFIDEFDVSQISRGRHSSSVSMVPQEPELFALTIRENVLLGGTAAHDYTDEDVWHALKVAHLENEVRALPQQLDTLLGERGTSLSGGQKQRLSIARAMLQKPKIILIDNSLAALDPETERIIFMNLKGSGTTVLCVTHRLSAMLASDKTMTVVEGKIESLSTSQSAFHSPLGWTNIFVETQRQMLEVEEVGARLAQGNETAKLLEPSVQIKEVP